MAKTSAERQRGFRERLRAEGKTQKLITVISKDWDSGYSAGCKGMILKQPDGVDSLSWLSGYIEGKGKKQMDEERMLKGLRVDHGIAKMIIDEIKKLREINNYNKEKLVEKMFRKFDDYVEKADKSMKMYLVAIGFINVSGQKITKNGILMIKRICYDYQKEVEIK